VPPQLEYPDLVPPTGWTYFRMGPQIRLIPPGTRGDTSPVAIIISPFVARQPQMPPPETLIQMALDAEARLSFEVTAQTGPTPIQTPTGLSGASLDVQGYPRPARPMEHRLYVMLADAQCYYGVSYLASPPAFDEHVAAFWALANSIRPFEGRATALDSAASQPAPPPWFSDE